MPNRGLYLRRHVTPFVILFIERDGSTFMVSMLSDHPEISIVYERFAVLNDGGHTAVEQMRWATSYFTPPVLGRDKAYGFKTKLKDILDVQGFSALLQERNVHVIHMRRQNIIKATVSKINARRLHDKTGNWNLYNDADRLPPVEIDLEQLDFFLQEREGREERLNSYVDTLQVPKMEISYEDLLQDQTASLKSVFDFLSVKWFPVQAKTKKVTKDDLRQVIENYSEVRSHFEGTRYGPMFDEVVANS